MTEALQETVEVASRLYGDGHLEEAMSWIESGLARDPHHGRLWELKGRIHRRRDNLDASLEALEMASLLVPLQPAGQCALADCYVAAGHHGLAHDLYKDLLQRGNLSLALLLSIAGGFDQLGCPHLALWACREASHRDPSAAQPYYDMGYYMGRCGYPASLVEALARKAIALAPERVNFRVGLASFLRRAGRERDAYHVIRDLRAEQIGQIGCRCCLERVMNLYRQVGDEQRSVWCENRLSQLAFSGEDEAC